MRIWSGILATASLSTLALAGLLAGCDKAPDGGTAQTAQAGNAVGAANANEALPAFPQALPMQAGTATALGSAPAANALPTVAPVQVASLASPGDSYAYLDRAAGQSDAYGDAPPDYAFDYDGVTPWAWQADDGSTEYAEPVDGGYRSYYYQGGQDQPYLVRDGDYSYAYAGAALVAIYAGGRLLPRQSWGDRARYAASYRARAENLYRASRDNRRGVNASNWAARRDQIARQRGSWSAQRQQQGEWAAYHRDHAAQEQDHWAQDREQRAAAAQRFDSWHQQGYRGQAPYARPNPAAAPQDRPGKDRAGQDKAGEGRPPENRPDDRQPPHPPVAQRPAPDRGDPQRSPSERPPAPAASARPERTAPPERAAPPAGRDRAPMLGRNAEHMRQQGIRPLDAPDHEPQRAAAPAVARSRPDARSEDRPAARPDARADTRPDTRRAQPEPRPAVERAPPRAEAPRPVREPAMPRAEAPRPAPHDTPHPAPPHGSEPRGGERHQ